jgi:hypothetical protein
MQPSKTHTQSRRRTVTIAAAAAICLMALIGAALVLYGTRWGPWAIEDTAAYFAVARHFALGRGLVNTRPSGSFPPMHIHPPFYSMALSPAAWLGLDLLQAARGMNAFLFAALILGVGFGCLRLARSPLLAVLCSGFLLVSTAMLHNYMGAMSEGLYFVLGFASLFLIVAALQKPRSGLLALAGLAAGLAWLTRFTGIAFAAAGAAAILLWMPSWRLRLAGLARFGLPAVLPYALWILYLRLTFPGVSAGYYDWHVSNLWQAAKPVRGALVDGLWRWFGLDLLWRDPPYRWELLILAGLTLLFVLLSAWGIRRLIQARRRSAFAAPALQLAFLFGTVAITTLAVVTFTYVFVVIPRPWLDLRVLSPIQAGLVLAAISWLVFLSGEVPAGGETPLAASRPGQPAFLRAASILLALGICAYNLTQSLPAVRRMHDEGFGYTSRAWQQSELIARVRRLPPETPLISHQPAPVFFLAGRPCYDLVSSLADAGHPAPVTPFGTNSSDPNQVLFREQDAALVLFDLGIHEQLRGIYAVDPTETLRRLTGGLQVVVRVQDGAIFTR